MAEQNSQFQKGDFIGPYRLLEYIGGGGFGEVWKAEHRDLKDIRAVKIPTDPEYVDQLRREGQLQFELKHSGIVRTLDLNTHHDPPYFVMEYIPGGDLRSLLKGKVG